MTRRPSRGLALVVAPSLALFLIGLVAYLPFTNISAAHNSPPTILPYGGNPVVSLKNARTLKISYVGPSELVSALQSGMAVPTSLAAADFDGDGAMDVVAGYSIAGRGVLTILRGNLDAYAPKDQSLYAKAAHGSVPSVFLPRARVLAVPESPDLLVTGDFNGDGHKDILVGVRGGNLYLLAGDGHGNFLRPQPISLPGRLTALAVNGSGNLAVGVAGASVPELLVFDSLASRLSAPRTFPLPAAATSVEWGALGFEGMTDLAVAAGKNIFVIYGALDSQAQSETISLPFSVKALALGEYIWDRDNRTEIAALADDGTIHILQHGSLDTRPLTAADTTKRPALRAAVSKQQQNPASIGPWTVAKQLGFVASTTSGFGSPGALQSPRLSGAPTYDLMVLDSHLNILDTSTPTKRAAAVVAFSGQPVAAYALPQKLNGERDIAVLTNSQTALSLLTAASGGTENVSETTDEDDAGACTSTSVGLNTPGPDGQLSLREAVCEANNYFSQENTGTVTINVAAGTYNLSLNTDGETGELQPGTVSGEIVSIVGLGATPADTVINQTDGEDRVIHEDFSGVNNVQLSISNLTLSGGSPSTGGGGAVLNGSVPEGDPESSGDTLTLTNLIITGNTTTGVGGGVSFVGGPGTTPLNVTKSAFTSNTATGGQGGGLEASLVSGTSAAITLSTFTGNSATATGQGGGIYGSGTITATDSRIVGNTASSGTGYYQASGTATVIDNWWGCNAGPGNTGCDTVGAVPIATATFNPWLVLGISANPTTIPIDGTSTLTADLTHDSNGGSDFSVPDGTPVTFGGTLGTVNPVNSTFTSGTSQSTFTAGNTEGAGSGTATVDNQTASATITITTATPTVQVTPNPSTITLGNSSQITVTVTGPTGGPTPTGTVSVSDGLGSGTGDNCTITLSNGTGSCTLTPSAAGNLTVTAKYGGDSNYNPAQGTAPLTVNPATPTVTVTPNPGTITLGNPSQITVAVTGPTGGPTPTGTVSVSDGLGSGAGDNCTITLSNGSGSCTLTPSAAGNLTVTAKYGGDSNYNPAQGTAPLTVNKYTPTVTVTPSSSTITLGQSQKYTVTLSFPSGVDLPTGTITVSDNVPSPLSGDSCTIVLPATQCILTPSAANPNPGWTVTASYPGDNNYNQASGTATLVVNKYTPTVTVTPSNKTITLGGSQTYTVAVSFPKNVDLPTGTITVSDNVPSPLSGDSCTIVLPATQCILTPSAANPSPGWTVTASYPGDNNYNQASGTATLVVNKYTPTVTVTPATSTITLGGSQTYTVTVSFPKNVDLPTGTITVSDNVPSPLSGDSCTIVLPATQCTLTPSAANPSPGWTVTASYPGDNNYNQASKTATLVVNKATPTVTVTPNPGTITLGRSSTITVTVTGPTGADIPTGTVNVTDGLGSGAGDNCKITLSNASGSCTLTPSEAGNLTVTATYNGDSNYKPAQGTAPLTVHVATPTVTVTPNPGTITLGQSSAITVTLTGPTGAVIPTGTVNVTDGLGSGAGDNCKITLSDATGSCRLTPSAAGKLTVTATYNGDSNYNSAPGTASLTVNKATPTVTVTPNPGTITLGQSPTITVTLTGPTGADIPTGTVNVTDGLGSGAGDNCMITLSNATGSCTLTPSAAGNLTVTAKYSGDSNYNPAQGTAPLTVHAATPTVTVTPNPSTITLGQSSTITVKVTGPTGADIPTGTVNVTDGLGSGAGDNCKITLSNATGSCTLTPSAAGNLTVTATYNGDSNYNKATGASTLTVNKATPTVTVPRPNAINLSQSSTITVTLTGPKVADIPTGTVSVSDGLGSGTSDNCVITLSSASGSCTVTPSGPGILTVTATYNADSNYNKASATTTLVVSPSSTSVAYNVPSAPVPISVLAPAGATVTFSCLSGSVFPPNLVNVTCGFKPSATVTLPTTVSVTLTVTPVVGYLLPAEQPRHKPALLYAVWAGLPGIVVLGLGIGGSAMSNRKSRFRCIAAMLSVVVLISLAFGLASCGGGFTPSGAFPGLGEGGYTVTVEETLTSTGPPPINSITIPFLVSH